MIDNLSIHTTPQLSGFFQTVVICHLQQPKYQSPVSPQTVVVANPNHNTDFSSGFPRTIVIVSCQAQYETIVWFVTNIGGRQSSIILDLSKQAENPTKVQTVVIDNLHLQFEPLFCFT